MSTIFERTCAKCFYVGKCWVDDPCIECRYGTHNGVVDCLTPRVGYLIGERRLKPLSQLIDEHAEWTTEFFERTYREAFEHGYKHGLEDGKNEMP